MRKETKFNAFGVEYKSKHFAAIPGFAVLAQPGDIHPLVLFADTHVKNEEGEWQPMSDPNIVNKYVVDVTGTLAPLLVLRSVVELVNDYNFGFLIGWQGVKVPTRFRSDLQAVHSTYSDPVISQLIQDGAATMQQLDEYYSLEDAFRLFDILVAKGVNTAKANEAAAKKSKK